MYSEKNEVLKPIKAIVDSMERMAGIINEFASTVSKEDFMKKRQINVESLQYVTQVLLELGTIVKENANLAQMLCELECKEVEGKINQTHSISLGAMRSAAEMIMICSALFLEDQK